MNGYRLTARAQEQVRSIWRGIAPESLQGADRVVDRVLASCNYLGRIQVVGEEWPGRPPGLRYYPVPRTQYLIIFLPDTDPVQIVGVVDGRRNQEDVSVL